MKIFSKTGLATASAIVSVCLTTSMNVNAQEAGFSADVDTTLNYDDNIFRSADENEVEDTRVLLKPELRLAGILGKQRFSAVYNGEYANYFDNSNVNYTDHNLLMRAAFDHSNRLSSRFDMRYKDVHEEASDVQTIFTTLDDFNRYSEQLFSGRFVYGRGNSFGQIVISLGLLGRDYDNNNQEFRSFDRDEALVRFYYRLTSRMRFIAEAIYQNFEYDPDTGFYDLDNEYVRYRVGLEWSFTNKLEGSVKAGYQSRDYRLSIFEDIDGLSYEADIDYLPNTYTTINFTGKRESIDSGLVEGGGYLQTSYSTTIKHDLTELVGVEGQLSTSKDELVFSVNRQDRRYYGKVGVIFDLRNWVDVSLNYAYSERSSNIDAADYKDNSINLTATFLLD